MFQFLTNICFSFKQIIIYLLNTKTVKQRPILISCFSFKRQAASLPVFVDFWQIFVSVLSKYLFTHKYKNHYSFQAYFSHIFFAFIFIVFSWMSAKLFILIQRYSSWRSPDSPKRVTFQKSFKCSFWTENILHIFGHTLAFVLVMACFVSVSRSNIAST